MLIFTHIPKTAGTSVAQNLKRLTDVVELYNVPVPEVRHQNLKRVVVGHIPIKVMLTHPDVAADDETTVLLSVVRDPVDRLVSTYNYVMANARHPRHEWAKGLTPRACLLEFAEREKNIQTQYLTGDVKWRIVVATLDHVAVASSLALNLAIGAKTAPADFERRFNETRQLQNPNTPSLSRDDLHPGLIEYLYESQDIDLKLYQRVARHGIVEVLPTVQQFTPRVTAPRACVSAV